MIGRAALRVDVLLPAVAGVCLLAVVAVGVVRQEARRNGPPLIGTMTHDFGIVDLGKATSPLRHTFLLRNQSKSHVQIQKVSTTCGCTDASTDVDRVPPGGSVRVSATLRLSDSGTKQAQVLLVTDQSEQRIVSMVLRATGRRARQLMALERHLAIQRGRSAAITIFAIDYESDQMPSPPQCSASDGLTVTFDGWTLVHPRHEATAQPARWQGRLQVSASSPGSYNSTGSIAIEPAGAQPISVSVDLHN